MTTDAPPPSFLSAKPDDPGPLSFLPDGQGQLALDAEDCLNVLAGRGHYTAESFRSREPRRYALIVRALAVGSISKNKIAQAFGVAWETVRAIERAEGQTGIREEKRGLAEGLLQIVELGIDGLRAQAQNGKLSAFDLKLLTDLWLTLSGEATQIVEHREDAAVAIFREALGALQMGSEGGKISTTGGGGGAAGDPVAAARPVGGSVIIEAPQGASSGEKPLDNGT